MAWSSGRFPADLFHKLQAFLDYLLTKESLVKNGFAVLPSEVPRQRRRGVADEPGESRGTARDVAVDPALQGEEVSPQKALAELDAGLDDAIGLMFMRGRLLLQGAAAMQSHDPLSQGKDG